MRSVLGIVLLAALAAAPLAAAQTPVYTVTIQNPGAFPALGANATGSASFQVLLAIENVVCAQAVTVPVAISATAAGAPAGVTIVAEPSVVNITIAAGPHPQGQPGGGTGDVSLKATTGALAANATVTITVQADAPAPAGPPSGCVGAGTLAGASSGPTTFTANLTAPPPPPVIEPTPEEKGFLPGPGALMGILAAVGAAMLVRRRS